MEQIKPEVTIDELKKHQLAALDIIARLKEENERLKDRLYVANSYLAEAGQEPV